MVEPTLTIPQVVGFGLLLFGFIVVVGRLYIVRL